jgi:hypothetical protein
VLVGLTFRYKTTIFEAGHRYALHVKPPRKPSPIECEKLRKR